MRKISLMVVMIMAGVLIGIGATSAFAAEPGGPVSGNTTPQQACVNGDYSAMQQYCGVAGNAAGGCGGGIAPADGSNTPTTTGFRRGMMGGGFGGMMGGRATY